MSTTTEKYKLIKPELSDPANITALNPNWDTIDQALTNQTKYVEENYLPSTGGTVTGTVVLSKVQDADGDSYTEPALVVGGTPDTYHLEIDNNEIQAKQNETTPGNLFLNSNGGKVTIGEGGLENRGDFLPTNPLKSDMGTATLPWNRIYARYLDLCGAADSLYGRFRVGTTGTEVTQGSTVLTLGNETPTGTANNASGKITMYGSGTGFTNILPNSKTSGSNTVYLPEGTGTLLLKSEAPKIASGSYVGAGTAKCSSLSALQSSGRKITFPFTPKIVIINAGNDKTQIMTLGAVSGYKIPVPVSTKHDMLFSGEYKYFKSTVGGYDGYIVYLNGNTMYLSNFNSGSTNYGYDVSGITYNWVAMG